MHVCQRCSRAKKTTRLAGLGSSSSKLDDKRVDGRVEFYNSGSSVAYADRTQRDHGLDVPLLLRIVLGGWTQAVGSPKSNARAFRVYPERSNMSPLCIAQQKRVCLSGRAAYCAVHLFRRPCMNRLPTIILLWCYNGSSVVGKLAILSMSEAVYRFRVGFGTASSNEDKFFEEGQKLISRPPCSTDLWPYLPSCHNVRSPESEPQRAATQGVNKLGLMSVIVVVISHAKAQSMRGCEGTHHSRAGGASAQSLLWGGWKL